MHELAKDEPLGTRLRQAMKWLQPIADNPRDFEHRDVIVEEINNANDPNITPSERAEHVTTAIEIILGCCSSQL